MIISSSLIGTAKVFEILIGIKTFNGVHILSSLLNLSIEFKNSFVAERPAKT